MLAIGGAFGVILVLKLVFGVFPVLGAAIDVRSPSGHVATATAAYGGLVLLLFGRRPGFCAAVAAAVIIGITRVALDTHSLEEVLLGGAVGTGAVLALGAALHARLRRRDATLLLALVATVVAVGYGRHADIEPRLQHVERRLRAEWFRLQSPPTAWSVGPSSGLTT